MVNTMWDTNSPLLSPTAVRDLNHSIMSPPATSPILKPAIVPSIGDQLIANGSENGGFDSCEILSGLAPGNLDNTSNIFNITDLLFSVKCGGDSNTTNSIFKQIMDSLKLYLTPIIVMIGLIGNTMSLLVFSLTHLQRLSSSFYLSSLAIADLGFLIGLSIVWLSHIGVELYFTEGWCQFVHYVRSVCGFMAIWNVVSFTMERYIIVYHPLQKDTFCTKRKARIVVLCLALFSLLFYLYTFWIYDVYILFGKKACSPLDQYYDIMTILTCVDTLFACVIPSLLIVVLNIRIIVKIHHYQTHRAGSDTPAVLPSNMNVDYRRRSLMHTSISTTGSMHIKFSSSRAPERQNPAQWQEALGANRKKPIRGQSQFRTARMLLILSSVFVLMNLPGYAFKVHAFVSRITGGYHKTLSIFIWHQFFEIIYFLNFAINFFIYSACGRQFRTGLRRLCKKWKYKVSKCRTMLPLRKLLHGEQHCEVQQNDMDGYNLKGGGRAAGL